MRHLFILITVSALSLCAQTSPAPSRTAKTKITRRPPAQSAVKLDPAKQFAVETVRAAVALPQSDPQDRLRVVAAAVEVAWAADPQYARTLAQEGLRIESELIGTGVSPAASVVQYADCRSAADFVQHIFPAQLVPAEQSLLNAVSRCSRETSELLRTRVDAGVQQGVIAPRLALAVLEKVGFGSSWGQTTFTRIFSALPPDARERTREAADFAALYANAAPHVAKDEAREAGLKLLVWLSKVNAGAEQNQAINVTVDGMKQILGQAGFDAALERDVIARQTTTNAGQLGGTPVEEEQEASPQEAALRLGSDQTANLQAMPANVRAREAAALGFAAGTNGKDKKAANRYFDIAFSAADEVWAQRNDERMGTQAMQVVNEVSEAAAHVDSAAALRRAQGFHDTAAQAIGMVAVARVVSGK